MSGSGEDANLAAGTEAVVEVVLVHPVLEVADPDRLVLLAAVPAGSGRRWCGRASPGRGGVRRRPRCVVLGELRRRRRGRHHGWRRVGDDDPPWLRHVVVRVRVLRRWMRMRVGVRVVRGNGDLRVCGGRCHLHHRRAAAEEEGRLGLEAREVWRAEREGARG